VHRWAAAHVREGRPTRLTAEEEGPVHGDMPDDADLVDWFRAGHAALVATLEAAPADLACWRFLPAPSPLAFWARRQAHETAVHRADAQVAAGAIDAVDQDFAVDGVDELLLGFYSRGRNRVQTDTPRVLAVAASDAEAAWLVHFGPDGVRAERGAGPADARLRAPASDLYLGLWNRWPLPEPEGDAELLAIWRQQATVG